MHAPVVAAHPHQPRFERAGRDGQDRGVVLRPRRVDGEPAAHVGHLLGGVVGGQVGGDDLPGRAVVAAPVDELAAGVDRGRVDGVPGESRVPVEAKPLAVRMRGADGLALAGDLVEALEVAALRRRIAVARIAQIGHGDEAVAAYHPVPVRVHDPAPAPGIGRPPPGAVVLKAAVDVERHLHVHLDVVELGQRQVLDKAPAPSAVVREGDAAIVAQDHPARVVGIDPELVDVAVDDVARDHGGEGAARVLGHLHRSVQRIDAVLVGRMGADVRVIEGPGRDAGRIGDGPPAAAAIVRAQQLAPLRLHQRVYDRGMLRRDRQPHAAEIPGRQPVLLSQLSPLVAAVAGDVEPAPRPSRLEDPRPALMLPERREELVRVRRIHDQLARAAPIVRLQDRCPGLAAVPRAVDAALTAGPPSGPHRRDVDDVRIRRMHDDAMDLPRVLEPHVGPALAPVEALIDAVADPGAVARIPLPGARPDDVRIGLEDGDGADAAHGLVVKDGPPGEPSVIGLPHTSARGTDEDHVAIREHHLDVRDPSAHPRGPDGTGLHHRKMLRNDALTG